MILIDDRAGSKELADYIHSSRRLLTRLEFGDVAFLGNGPSGSVRVGIEVKSLPDLLSCISTARFAGFQLPGMLRSYDVPHLMVHGRCRACPETGLLQWQRKGRWEDARSVSQTFTYQSYAAWLNTMRMGAGIHIEDQLFDIREVAERVMALEHWWSKSWGDHKSLQVFRRELPGPASLTPDADAGEQERAGFKDRHSLLRRWAAGLPGVGWRRSMDLEKHFDSALELVLAEVPDLIKVPGIGKGIAEKITQEVRRGKGD